MLTIVVPTRNEAGNVSELVSRIEAEVLRDPVLDPELTEVLFVDDSADGTPEAIASAGATSALQVRCLHRDRPVGGLGGAVHEGLQAAKYDRCIVMDGDLQHPPELIGVLAERLATGDADVVVASRYLSGGDDGGLANALRRVVSKTSRTLVKALFPIRLHGCSDPMSGFFAVDRRAVDLTALRPRGFKILFEMLARQQLRVAEVPLDFGARTVGTSKATWGQGSQFLRQLVRLRFGRLSGFAAVGAVGAVINITLVWLLTGWGVGVIPATVLAAEVTIIGNFLVWDRFVFGDIRGEARGFWARFVRSFAFNNVEAAIRIALVVWIVDRGWMGPALATAVLLAIAFVVRYIFHALVVYAPKR